MKRVLALVLTAVLMAGPAYAAPAEPPHAKARLERVAGELRKEPLFVDMDLAHVLDETGRRRVREAMTRTRRSLGVPVYVVVIPNSTASESGGEGEILLFELQERIRGRGLYLVADHHGYIDAVAFGVPREVTDLFTVSEAVRYPGNERDGLTDVADRLVRGMNEVVAMPPGPPNASRRLNHAPSFDADDTPPPEPEIVGPLVGGLVLGAAAGGLLYGLFAAAGAGAARLRRRGPRTPAAPVEPSARWLRREAAKEIARLADLLPSAENAPGRSYAIRAYDAAKILYDDAGDPPREDDATVLDLTGAIVLARQGRQVLDDAAERPDPPCYVNPLHGPAAERRKIAGQGGRPVCAGCARVGREERTRLALKVPGGQVHYAVPGRWQRNGFGSRNKNLASNVLESLGVD
ncbi:hypothetical protein [Thermomonospora amylolytica]|uniref:hypothetical protein n=1 Tax=Thermomonospora amylolytica TaxID=1411117 RepID=UPI000E6CF8EC|nr:hypothetical protein [Thermomonospora amylolytica]